MDTLVDSLRDSLKEKLNSGASVLVRTTDSFRARIEQWRGASSVSQAPAPQQEPPSIITLQLGVRAVPSMESRLRSDLWLTACMRRDSAGDMVGARMIERFTALASQDLPQEVVTDIDKDIRRTYPCYVQFGSAEGQEELRMVLRAYAAYDPEVGYCQGMNFVAGTILLFVRNPAEAFAALVLLMQERGLRKFYVRSMSLLQVQLWQLSKLMSPKLCQHLEMFGVVPMLYGASWLMTGFSADFPITFSARILDVMLTDKCHCALLKVAVAIMKRCERTLRQMSDLEDIVKFLKVEVPKWDEYELDDILSDAFSKPWTPRQMSILNNTEDVETVAQGMERVMNLQEQASRAHGDDDDDEDHSAVPRSGGDDGSHSGGKGGQPIRLPIRTSHSSEPGGFQSAPVLAIPMLAPPPSAGSSSSSCLVLGQPSGGGSGGGAISAGGSGGGAIPPSPFTHGVGSGGGGAPVTLAACRSADAALVLASVPEGLAPHGQHHGQHGHGPSRLAQTGSAPGLPAAGSGGHSRHLQLHGVNAHGHGHGHSHAHGHTHGGSHGHAQAQVHGGHGGQHLHRHMHGQVHAHAADPRAWAVPQQPSPLLEDFARQHPQALAAVATQQLPAVNPTTPLHHHHHGHHHRHAGSGGLHLLNAHTSGGGSPGVGHGATPLTGSSPCQSSGPSVPASRRESVECSAFHELTAGLRSAPGGAAGNGASHTCVGDHTSPHLAAGARRDVAAAAAGGCEQGGMRSSDTSPPPEHADACDAGVGGVAAGVWNLYPPPHSLELPPESPTHQGVVAPSGYSFGSRSPFGRSVEVAAAVVTAAQGTPPPHPPAYPTVSPVATTEQQRQQQASPRGITAAASGIGGGGNTLAAGGDPAAVLSGSSCQPTSPAPSPRSAPVQVSSAFSRATGLLGATAGDGGSGEFVLVSHPSGDTAAAAAAASASQSPRQPRSPASRGAGGWPLSSPRGGSTDLSSIYEAVPGDGPPPLQDWTSVDVSHEPDGFDELACSGTLSTKMLQELKRGWMEAPSAAPGAEAEASRAAEVSREADAHPGVGYEDYLGLTPSMGLDGSCSPSSVASTMHTLGSFRSSSPGPGLAVTAHHGGGALAAVECGSPWAVAGGDGSGRRREASTPLLSPAGDSGALPPVIAEAGVGCLSAVSCWPTGPAGAAGVEAPAGAAGELLMLRVGSGRVGSGRIASSAGGGISLALSSGGAHTAAGRSAGGAFSGGGTAVTADAAATATGAHGSCSGGGAYPASSCSGEGSQPGSGYSSRGGSVGIRSHLSAGCAATPPAYTSAHTPHTSSRGITPRASAAAAAAGAACAADGTPLQYADVAGGTGNAQDDAGDLAGDILRGLFAFDSQNAGAAYDPKAKLGEAMFADSPMKEAQTFFQAGCASPFHLRSGNLEFPNNSPISPSVYQHTLRIQKRHSWGQGGQQQLANGGEGGQEEAEERHTQQSPAPKAYRALSEAWEVEEASSCAWKALRPGAAEGGAGTTGGGTAVGDGSACASPQWDSTRGSAGCSRTGLMTRQSTLRYVDGIPIFDPKVCMHAEDGAGDGDSAPRLGASALPSLVLGGGEGPHANGCGIEAEVVPRAAVATAATAAAAAEAAEAATGAARMDGSEVAAGSRPAGTENVNALMAGGSAGVGSAVVTGAAGQLESAQRLLQPMLPPGALRTAAPLGVDAQQHGQERLQAASSTGCDSSSSPSGHPANNPGWAGSAALTPAAVLGSAPAEGSNSTGSRGAAGFEPAEQTVWVQAPAATPAGDPTSHTGAAAMPAGAAAAHPGAARTHAGVTTAMAGITAVLDSGAAACDEVRMDAAPNLAATTTPLPSGGAATLPPALLQGALTALEECTGASNSPHTPLVARMELPHGTSVLQLAAAAAAMQAAMDAAKQDAGCVDGVGGVGRGTPAMLVAAQLRAGAGVQDAACQGDALVTPTLRMQLDLPAIDGSHAGGQPIPAVRGVPIGQGSAATTAGVEFGAWTAGAGAPQSLATAGCSPPTATNSFYPSTTSSSPLPRANSKSVTGSPDRAVTAATAATAATPTDAASEGAAPCAAATAEEQQLAALQLAVAAAGQDICPAALQAALQATCWSASGGASGRSGSMGGAFHPGSPHTPLVAKMELPRGTSVLQLAHAAAAVQAALDAAAAEAASGTALAGACAAAAGLMGAAAAPGAGQAEAQAGAEVMALGTAKGPSPVSSLLAMDAVRLTPPSGWESHAGTDRTNSLSRGVSSELDHGTPTGALDTDPGQLQVVNHHD